MAAKINKAAASSRKGELLFRTREDTPAFKPSDTDMLPPSLGMIPEANE
jgi:hypothetical protein